MGHSMVGRAIADDASAGMARQPGAGDDAEVVEWQRLAVAAIEERRAGRACPHCSAAALGRWGSTPKGRRRWRCRSCQRTCCGTTDTVLLGLHKPDKFAELLTDMTGDAPRACRPLAASMDVDKTTVWRWRRRVAEALLSRDRPPAAEMLESTSCIVRESRKASREWVRHAQDPLRFPPPDRRRWIDYRVHRLPLPQPMTPYLIEVRLVADGRGGGAGQVIYPNVADPRVGPCETEGAATTSRCLQNPLASFAPGSAGFAKPAQAVDNNAREAATATSVPRRGLQAPADAARCAAFPSLRSRFAAFIGPFRGPSTRHLPGYVAWFVARLPDDASERLRRVWDHLLGGSPTRFADMAGC